MMQLDIETLRSDIRANEYASEPEVVDSLLKTSCLNKKQRARVTSDAIELVKTIRKSRTGGAMSSFLVEYGLSSREGIALMCLAEALLRVPDAATIDSLISDKIAPGNWGRHLGHSSSSLVNASTWALMLTGKMLGERERADLAQTMREVLKRLGEPVVRVAVAKAIELIADQFILGVDIQSAVTRSKEFVRHGYRYSYDMLGESALTGSDAKRYMDAYVAAINHLAHNCDSGDFRDNPGISVKLSAIHPRYQTSRRSLIIDELTKSVLSLAILAKDANMGLNIDAEEADKLDLSLDVFERVLAKDELAGWDGFGIVVQAYSQRAIPVIRWAHALAKSLQRRIMLRLVKGAYWDTEIKHAQVLGTPDYQVFTHKSSTDLSYLACAFELFARNDHIFPQFATHNVHTIRSVIEMSSDSSDFEFQRLHGMGVEVHEIARHKFNYRCRIYAPVGAHEDLLAYLVRRILENGANSSFVNQLMDQRVPVEAIVSDPVRQTKLLKSVTHNPATPAPRSIYGASRLNALGLDMESESGREVITNTLDAFASTRWIATPSDYKNTGLATLETTYSPTDTGLEIGKVYPTDPRAIADISKALYRNQQNWETLGADYRAVVLRKIARQYEKQLPELVAMMIRECGKTIADAIAEVREAIDFCRYYANEALKLEHWPQQSRPRGTIVCISPWNFPLAIFTGQIVGALAAGNSVIAKPAEQTPLVASKAIRIMHNSGVPQEVLSVYFGLGETVGAPLVANPEIDGVCFTGSSEVAWLIHRTMAKNGNPKAVLVAETGGLNAMIVDSTALPEQAVRDIIASAFQSAGQRCSALRMLYVQQEIRDRFCTMLFGAMEQLIVGDPWNIETDIGPVIDAAAKSNIDAYLEAMKTQGRLLYQTPLATDLNGYFVPPTVFEVAGIEDLEQEIFGPVLHIASFQSADLPQVIEAINHSGYGLTFGLHTRIDRRVQQLTESVNAGNVYVNRNQIGAVVGCQPFGGRGLSGTGPKAGGSHYVPNLRRFADSLDSRETRPQMTRGDTSRAFRQLRVLMFEWAKCEARASVLSAAIESEPGLVQTLDSTIEFLHSPVDLDGPTGESNRLYIEPKGIFVCLGYLPHVIQALVAGNAVLAVGIDKVMIQKLTACGAPVFDSNVIPDSNSLLSCEVLAGIAFERLDPDLVRTLRVDLAKSAGPIVQFVIDTWAPWQFIQEKSLCIDTTAAGGNARLLIESGS